MIQFFIFFFLSLFLSQSALGAVSKNSLFLGVESGGLIKHSTTTAEDSGQGLELGVKLLTTRLWRGWDVDFGGGWRINSLREENVTVKTRTFFAETAIREKLSDRFSVGPMLSALFGRDVSFSDFGTNSDNKSMALFVGGKALYEMPWKEIEGRIGVQVQTDLNIGDRQITQIQAVAEFSWPFNKRKKSYSRPLKLVPTKTRFNLSQAGLRFGLDSDDLSYSSKTLVDEIASALLQHQDEWQTVSIDGHSDSQGKSRYNLGLSLRRASSVKRVFQNNGIPNRRLAANGYGDRKPIDRRNIERAHAKNRRVEFTIHGLEEGGELSRKISRILN